MADPLPAQPISGVQEVRIDAPGTHVIGLEVTTFSDRCSSFYEEETIVITPAPTVTVNVELDTTQLCAETIVIVPVVTSTNAETFTWSSNSPDVSFSDPTVARPTITIDNSNPGSRLLVLTVGSASCSPVFASVPVTTFTGQRIEVTEDLVTCTGQPYRFCDQLVFLPEPRTISWSTTAGDVNLQDAQTKCPTVTFGAAGSVDLIASGVDICGQSFEIAVPVRVRDGAPLVIDLSPIDTLCVSEGATDLLPYLTPAGNLASVTGRGVTGTVFNPAGLDGPVELTFLDSCGFTTTENIFVRAEGAFAGGDPVVCSGDVIDLARLQEGNFTGPGVTGTRFSSVGLAPGPYRIEYVSDAYCGGSGTFTITVEEPVVANFALTSSAVCADTVQADGVRVFPLGASLQLINRSAAEVVCYAVVGTEDSICGNTQATFAFDRVGDFTLRQIVRSAGGGCQDTLSVPIRVVGELLPVVTQTVDSSQCDSFSIAYELSGIGEGADFMWSFSSGDTSVQRNPTIRLPRPVSDRVQRTILSNSNGCESRLDTLTATVPLRFQVSFGILNDNNTVCSGEPAFLIDNSVNAAGLVLTYPDGSERPGLPDSLVITNAGEEVLVYPLRLRGFNGQCPEQEAFDTLYILPVSTEAAFTLEFDQSCSPVEVRATNLSTPGATSWLFWGDGTTRQPFGEGATLQRPFRSNTDTTFTISASAELCGVDSFSTQVSVRGGAVAGFTTDAGNGTLCADREVIFLADEVEQEQSLRWTFGDGDSSLVRTPTHRYASGGTYPVRLVAVNRNGCRAEDSLQLTVVDYAGPPLAVGIPGEACVGGPFEISASFPGLTATYDYGNSLRSAAPIAAPYQEEGDYVFTLTVADANGCERDSSTIVRVLPAYTVSLQPDEEVIVAGLGEAVPLSFTTSPARLLDSVAWRGDSVSTASGLRTVAVPTRDGIYSLQTVDEFGCTATDSVLIRIETNYRRLVYVPNAFSPNGDGSNESFTVDGRRAAIRAVRSFRVFSRWGASVYECTECPVGDPDGGWRGRLGDQAVKPGVYAWAADIEFTDGHREVFRGDVTLLR